MNEKMHEDMSGMMKNVYRKRKKRMWGKKGSPGIMERMAEEMACGMKPSRREMPKRMKHK